MTPALISTAWKALALIEVPRQVPGDDLNTFLFVHLHATILSPHWLVSLAAWMSEGPLFLALALVVVQLTRRRDVGGLVRIVLAFAFALATEELISRYAFHSRPFAAGLGPAWVTHAANNSMPSTHVTLTLILAFLLSARGLRGSGVVLFVLACLLAWARVYVGIHWPADMLGAVISAGASVAAAEVVFRLLVNLMPGWRPVARRRPGGARRQSPSSLTPNRTDHHA